VTPLQLARAFAAIANGGFLLRPYVVQRVSDPEGQVLFLNQPTPILQVIRTETARTLTSLLKQVVEEGTGRLARVEGFPVAGKTGTAQKVEQGRYSAHGGIASFVGFVPADRPRLVILVVVDEPKTATYGGQIAAPVFQAIARQGLEQLGIKRVEEGTRVMKVALPHLSAASDSGPLNRAQDRPFDPSTTLRAGSAQDRPVLQPPPLSHIGQGTLNPGAYSPNFLGMSLREAMVSAARWGCRVEIQGNGYVISQEPLPDTEESAEKRFGKPSGKPFGKPFGERFRLTLQARAAL
jgi:membrane peptidoglycan carboxypeptidase